MTEIVLLDDDFDVDELDIVNGYSKQRRPSQAAVDRAILDDEDAQAQLKRQFEEALRDRELAQQKLEVLSKKFQGAQLR